MKKVVDSGFLACDHHVYMSIGVSAAINSKECDEIMIIGLGGGGLCTFLYNCFPKVYVYYIFEFNFFYHMLQIFNNIYICNSAVTNYSS